jgi:hypothetical protein
LNIIERDADELVVDNACRLLVYVSDERSTSRLRNRLRMKWEAGGMAGSELWALTELGDAETADWIQTVVAALPADDRRAEFLESHAKLIRIQLNPDTIPTLILASGKGVDRCWLIRNAVRLGVNKSEIRNAAVGYLRSTDMNAPSSRDVDFAQTCAELGLFTPEEEIEYKPLMLFVARSEAGPPSWATKVRELRRKFYSPPKAREE